jgi:hypothetical protein
MDQTSVDIHLGRFTGELAASEASSKPTNMSSSGLRDDSVPEAALAALTAESRRCVKRLAGYRSKHDPE